MGSILVKPGVDFGAELAPAGAQILDHLKRLVAAYPFNVTITSARDGVHSGPADPHHSGEAFDLRTHDLTQEQKGLLLTDLQKGLGERFFAFLEAPNTDTEHIHVQRRRATTYSVLDYLSNA